VLVQPWQLTLVMPVAGHVVALRQRGRDIDLTCYGLGCSRRPPSRRDHITGPDQGLAGNAGPVRAFAAEKLPLDQRDAEAAVGAAARDHLTSRAGADNDHIEFLHHSLLGSLASAAIRQCCCPIADKRYRRGRLRFGHPGLV